MSPRRRVVVGVLAALVIAPAHGAPDPARGAQIYTRCAACHALAFDRVGPHHCGLFGRRAGSVPGFGYSVAMKKSRIVWGDKSLDRFLASPMTAMPGTAMTYAGVPDAAERADLIAYLRQADTTAECSARRAAKR